MREVGAFEAKNTLGALLDLVEQGQDVLITRRGKPVARLTKVDLGVDRDRARAAVAKIKELRKGLTLAGLTVQELRDEGRP
jgi:prevent-host-death family protein